ncbi:MAG TPA: C25 family cysteine peptidase, partial [Thermoguttaceae bacterium]|nr:C25 family cysteine peptidase [Thermoguttaceae bacterium]
MDASTVGPLKRLCHRQKPCRLSTGYGTRATGRHGGQRPLRVEALETRSLLNATSFVAEEPVLDGGWPSGPIPSDPSGIVAEGASEPTAGPENVALLGPFGAKGRLLIVAGGGFAGMLSGFVAHKTGLGWMVDVADTATVGASTTEIRDYVRSRYDDPATRPDALLLVGDTVHIPAFSGVTPGNPATDLYYACMDDGDDWYPEFPVGRFSVSDGGQLLSVIDKTIEYETTTPGEWGKRVAFMAGHDLHTITEGTHDWVIDNYMDPLGYTSDKLYADSYGATTGDVRDGFNEGRLLGVYAGHGTVDAWADGPPFSQSDVRSLTNVGMYPFVASFACLTGQYTADECFVETWLREPNKGAVGSWGASVPSYWTEDSVLEKKLFEAIYDDGRVAFAGAATRAKELFIQEFGPTSTSRKYSEMYNLFGDPTAELPIVLDVLQIDGTMGDDVIRVLRDADNPSLIHVFLNSQSPVETVQLSTLRRINVNGRGGDDTLIVDSSNGLITLPRGILYDGGDGFDDFQLVQPGGDAQTSDTLEMGVLPGLGQSTIVGPGGTQTVHFEDLERIGDLVPSQMFNVIGRSVDIPEGSSGSDCETNYQVSQIVTNGGLLTAENLDPIEFRNKGTLVIDAGNAAGPILLFGLDRPTVPGWPPVSSGTATLTVATPGGTTTTYTPSLTALHSGSVQVSELLQVNYVNLNGEVTISDPDGTLVYDGTAGDDEFSVDASGNVTLVNSQGSRPAVNRGGQRSLILNGLEGRDEFAVAANAFPNITVRGGADDDTVIFQGNDAAENVKLWPTHGTFTSDGFLAAAESVESITAHGGGGDDVAALYDSQEADTLAAGPDSAELTGPGFALAVSGFRQVHAFASDDGEVDMAVFEDLAGHKDRFRSWATDQATEAKMWGLGFFNRAKGFDDVR